MIGKRHLQHGQVDDSKHQQHGLKNKICVRRLTSAVFAIWSYDNR